MKHEPITKSQLADLLGLSLRTLQRKLLRAELNIPRGLISPDSQIQILMKLGYSALAAQLRKKSGRINRSDMLNPLMRISTKIPGENRKKMVTL